ncbi:hypothetical protein ABTY61_06555 [Kitasatospora sp. NPDC096128]|uniref:hypothetical protein n=1 Tax=Kitasatospora sp. NPDC096128 TaxID=3155547 RepID=UPI00332B9A1E
MDGRQRRTAAADGRARRRGPLARRVAFGLRSRALEATRGARTRTVVALGLLSVGLLAAGLRTTTAPLALAVTGCWALVLALAAAVLRACAGEAVAERPGPGRQRRAGSAR